MRIAVTGASGKLGSAIILQLLKQVTADQVIGLARNVEKAKILEIEIRKGDYSDEEKLIDSLNDIDTVLLVSGMDVPDKRIEQHRNVINAAKKSGVKKIVYTSVIGSIQGSSFSPVVASNRQTEQDIKNSGLNWVIGRNGLYIEPDIEYIENYKKAGKIANCAGDRKCSYTTRDELGYAYSKMLIEDKHNNKIYNLGGEPISQQQLTDFMNHAFGTSLVYESMDVKEYEQERKAQLGEFLGTIIAGIYSSIRDGAMQFQSNFNDAAGREHISWPEYFQRLRLS